MKVVFIIANVGFQDTEYEAPKKILEEAGFEVVTAAKNEGVATGKFGSKVKVDLCLGNVLVPEYDAVVFIGGPGAVKYQEDVEAHLIARDAVEQKKVIGAICITPTILAHAGILEGVRATVWNNDNKQGEKIEKMGAIYISEPVVVDNNFVTANGPDAAKNFGEKLVEVLNS